jgi:hypothetical protein
LLWNACVSSLFYEQALQHTHDRRSDALWSGCHLVIDGNNADADTQIEHRFESCPKLGRVGVQSSRPYAEQSPSYVTYS